MKMQLQILAFVGVAVAGLMMACRSTPRETTPVPESEITNYHAGPAVAGMLFEAKPGSKMRIEGTSTIHDWQVESALIGGFIEVGPCFPVEPGQVVAPGKVQARVEAFVPVRSLKSIEKDGEPYSDRMDDVMYEKLENPRYARIRYRLEELTLKQAHPEANSYEFESRGQLTVAGVTNIISMPVTVVPLGGRQLKVAGRCRVKMTDFGIKPPSPAFLPIKTGDDVNLIFEWKVGAKNPLPK